MSEHTRTITVDAPADVAFGYLSDARNLPDFMPRMRSVEPQGDGIVAVTAVVTPDGKQELEVHGTAQLEVDEAARTMRWSSERHSYHGSLAVTGERPAELQITLSTEHGDPATIDMGLDQALEAIKTRIEARV
ncbi:SRPBCC family protein [Arsenicicoccus dermatophilus]|uniref:SRPBCC family protein n=1 Tax=Arsenicicoccus dermatophilus TaxID=1076331 RepID=UPI001F4CAF25|nr:SRPBCC family protein [Arsenicicoccus dermatophilus]MCH8614254.1 SRPBCC family protein [Arsenicicoccus dermatophilus]